MVGSDEWCGMAARSDDDLEVEAGLMASLRGRNISLQAIEDVRMHGASIRMEAERGQDVTARLKGGRSVVEALFLEGASLQSADDEWSVENNRTRETYHASPMSMRSEEDVVLSTSADREVIFGGGGGVQISTMGNTGIVAGRIAMTAAWNEDVSVMTTGGMMDTGGLQLSGGGVT